VDPDGGGPGLPFTFDDPDFNLKSLRINAIFRWEWKLGSTLYFVWTENREDKSNPGQFRPATSADFSRPMRTTYFSSALPTGSHGNPVHIFAVGLPQCSSVG